MESLTSNADLAPTILEAAGVDPATVSRTIDGISLLPLAEDRPSPAQRQGILIETNKVSAVRQGQFLYAEYAHSDSRELYDLDQDPLQLDNRIEDPALGQKAHDLKEVLDALQGCKGDEPPRPCRSASPPPVATRPPVNPGAPSPVVVAPLTLPGVGQNEPYAITCDKARLDGWVNPHGSPTTWFFEYWKRGVNVPSRTGSGDAGAGDARVAASRLAESLQADTGYSAVLIADNAAGRSISSIVSFKTRRSC